MSDDLVVVTVADGKYTFGQRKSGSCYALRYGEPWREDIFDGLMLAMAHRIAELEAKLDEEIRISNLRGNMIEFNLLPSLHEAEAKLRESAMQELAALGQAQDAHQAQLEAEAKLAKALEALQSVMEACDQGRMIPRSGAGGMTIEANIKGSIYVGVSAWPIEEARTTLAELTGGEDE